MKTFLEVLDDPPTPVDCGTCPVNVRCALGGYGNGWTYDCCRVSAIDEAAAVIIIDCQRHTFIQCADAKKCTKCPLCSGDIVKVAKLETDPAMACYYVPTVHAKVPLSERLRLWRKK